MIAFSPRASETPTAYAYSHAGHFFFTATPDQGAATRADQAGKPAASAATAATAAITTGYETDRYLNQRKQLLELLDALVAAGAYQKHDVAAGTVPGTDHDGVLYTATAGVEVSNSGIGLGPVLVKGPLKQDLDNPRMLKLSASYMFSQPPQWAQALAKTDPRIARKLAGGSIRTLALANGTSEFPYIIEAPYLN